VSFLASIPSPDSGTLDVGPFTVHMYGLTLLAAIALCTYVAGRRWVARGGDWDLIFRCAVWGVAAGIVGAFEDQLEEAVLLAFFVPGVVYMADAVGTQTEAVVIRGIAVGVPVRHVMRRELLTGLVVGIVIAALFLPLAWLIWSDGSVAVAVALALFASCATATIVAMGLPYLLHALGRDPAFGSGPLATVIQDLLSILIYFAITVPIVL